MLPASEAARQSSERALDVPADGIAEASAVVAAVAVTAAAAAAVDGLDVSLFGSFGRQEPRQICSESSSEQHRS